MSAEALFAEFEDIEEARQAALGELEEDEEEEEEFDESKIEVLDAKQLSQQQIMAELDARGIHPKGFFEDDAAALQEVLVKEHDEYVQTLKQKAMEDKERRKRQAGFRRRRMLMERQLREEDDELSKYPEVRTWLDVINDGTTKPIIQLRLNSVLARSLAKSMLYNVTVTALDLSNCDLDDFGGAYVGRLLKTNETIQKLELSNNRCGPLTLKMLAQSLRTNNSLSHLALEANPLLGTPTIADDGGAVTEGADQSGLKAFTEMLAVNQTLITVNFWHCGLDRASGRILAHGLQQCAALLFFDFGNNRIAQCDQNAIIASLEKNRAAHSRGLATRRAAAAVRREEERKAKEIADKEQKHQDMLDWLDAERVSRIEEGRIAVEKAIERQRVEEEKRAKEEAERKEREAKEKEAAASKKKKKGKKGKKK